MVLAREGVMLMARVSIGAGLVHLQGQASLMGKVSLVPRSRPPFPKSP